VVIKWTSFLSTLRADRQPGEYLQHVAKSLDKAKFVLLFTIYLFDTHELRDEQIFSALTSLRFHFESNVGEADFMDHGLLKRARAAAGHTTEEAKVALPAKAARAFLPLVLPMRDWIKEGCWDITSWDTAKDVDSKILHLMVDIALDTGFE
jgi:hypothetical protein